MQEAKARIKINKLLEDSGWRFFKTPDGPATILVEPSVKLEEAGDDFEKIKKGFVDYLLLDESGFPVCVLEAKSEDKDPLIGKEQARDYANSQKVRFILLSNGNIHYFWDKELGNPTRISRFPSVETLNGRKKFSPDTSKLVREDVRDNYIVLTQNPYYQQDPRWKDESQRKQFIEDTGLKFLRPYQLDAVKKIQKEVSENKNRFLFEMATGTGKTLVAGAIIKLYLRTNNANRVLFLVDRLELENQANKDLKSYLNPDYTSVVFKENRDDWKKSEVVVTTIQSISYENKYLKLFSPTDFDLIISDEAHRSISGNSRVIFEYFIGAKLGLTATPKDYLKNLDEKELADTDPREYERRVLLSTYKTFGCESGIPTFRYTLEDGINDGYLVRPVAVDCRTDITTQLLSDEGYAVLVQTQEGEEEEVIYKQKDFERKFFSDLTNKQFVKTFLENANRDPITGEIGKTIIFCVSRKHAGKITQILNEYAMEMFPGKYQSDFAIQITSDIPDAQQFTMNFANNNLRGFTHFLEGYKTSKTRVCVTVGMMTTGYDCRDILNLCMMRPIFSPTDFVQIRGRGTRKYTFSYTRRDGGQEITERQEKQNFKLFDFFANCEYFEEKYPYDAVIELPPTKGEGGGPQVVKPDKTVIDIPDPLKTMVIFKPDGEEWRIDKELFSHRFESEVKETYKESPEFKDFVDSGNYEEMERYVRSHLFDKPEYYFNLDKLRQGYNSDRRLSLWEILDKVFGKIHRFKTKDEIAEEEFEKFVIDTSVPPDIFYETREFFKTYIVDEDTRTKINKKDYSAFAGDPMMTHILTKMGSVRLKEIPEYIKDNVNLNRFM
ncbi:MAG TPA: DEAD/DEAH box helicase family protein [Syntrophales bacterium]|nr:DEAD/DEAH box helicase family protein [Syntrophales bacterium]